MTCNKRLLNLQRKKIVICLNPHKFSYLIYLFLLWYGWRLSSPRLASFCLPRSGPIKPAWLRSRRFPPRGTTLTAAHRTRLVPFTNEAPRFILYEKGSLFFFLGVRHYYKSRSCMLQCAVSGLFFPRRTVWGCWPGLSIRHMPHSFLEGKSINCALSAAGYLISDTFCWHDK